MQSRKLLHTPSCQTAKDPFLGVCRSPRISSGLPSCHYTIAQCFVTTLEREPVPLTREFTVQRLCAGDEGYMSPTPHATASTYNHHGPSCIR
ncbi:hypothetical protein CPAR01_08925 [Colletotrichum paranaense]|uniref:Uncharacterized protein n=1 Tax=Colletotrichum paranaense TaxID=1914294 RepID=A0ABQ9SFC7_9PEZI|nr:uncharacterized protein CPAR01_08925 [Colletotrichum paranaense]KAK1535383.1 hypothetical protein CPAR01_08925 [Colletotrichum paranaense]